MPRSARLALLRKNRPALAVGLLVLGAACGLASCQQPVADDQGKPVLRVTTTHDLSPDEKAAIDAQARKDEQAAKGVPVAP